MPTVIIDPTSDDCNGCGNDPFTPSSGTTLWNVLAKGTRSPTAPSLTPTIVGTQTNNESTYTVACANSIPSNATVTAIKLWIYGTAIIVGGGNYIQVAWATGSFPSVVSGSATDYASPTNAWTSFSWDHTSILTSNSGSELTHAQIVALGFQTDMAGGGPGTSAATTQIAAYMEVTYTTPGGAAPNYLPILGCG